MLLLRPSFTSFYISGPRKSAANPWPLCLLKVSPGDVGDLRPGETLSNRNTQLQVPSSVRSLCVVMPAVFHPELHTDADDGDECTCRREGH